jgi:hypothetical protein
MRSMPSVLMLVLLCGAARALPQVQVPASTQGDAAERAKLREELKRIEARLEQLELGDPKARPAPTPVAATPPEGPAASQASESPTWKELISGPNRFRFYGSLRLDVQYDDSRPNNTQTIGWILSEDPMAPPGIGAGGKNKEDLTIHPRLTRLGVDFDGGTIQGLNDAMLTGKVEIDFYNNGLLGQSESRDAIRMRHAWLKLAWSELSLLFGQTSDVISPIFPIVNADLVMWGAGNLGDRRPQIRGEYRHNARESSWIVQGEIGLTGADDNQDLDSPNTFGAGFRDGETSGLPTLQARVAYAWPQRGKSAEVGIWGHRAWEEPDTKFAGEDEFDSSAVGFDATLPITSEIALKAEAWSGENVDDVRGGIFQGINTTTGEEIESRGGFVELGWQATPRYQVSAGYSRDDPDNGDVGSGGRANNEIWYLANRWKYDSVTIGLDYLNWTTEYVGFGDGTDNRFNAFIQYSF